MKFYIKNFSKGVVDEGQKAQVYQGSNSELLEANDVYANLSGNLTRRPPLKPIVEWNTIRKGRILDVKFTDKHLILLREVSLDWIFKTLNDNHPLYKDAFVGRVPDTTDDIQDEVEFPERTVSGESPYIF